MIVGGQVLITYCAYARFGSVTGSYFSRIEKELIDIFGINVSRVSSEVQEILVTEEFFIRMRNTGVLGSKVSAPSIKKELFTLSVDTRIFSISCQDSSGIPELIACMIPIADKIQELHRNDVVLIELKVTKYINDFLAK